METTTALIVSFVATTMAVIAVSWGIYTWFRQRSLERRVARRWRRRFAEVGVVSVPNPSIVITVRNAALEPAHNYHVYARFPEGSRIDRMTHVGFTVKKGGRDYSEVVFHKGLVNPGMHPAPLTLHATKDNQDAALEDILAWCDEERGFISIPPNLEEIA